MDEFAATARSRGQQPVLTIIPTGPDLKYFHDHGEWVYASLIRRLKEDDKFLLLDFGRAMAERLSDSDPCALFDDCHAHFNEAGYRMLAEIMAEFLRENGLARN